MPGIEIKGRSKIANYRHGGRTGKFGGGRTNLLEQLGRVEAEPSNPNRRAEISRVHGELNRGYAKGGRAGKAIGGILKVGKEAIKKIISRIKKKPETTWKELDIPGYPPIHKGKYPAIDKAMENVKKHGDIWGPGKAEGGRIGLKHGGWKKPSWMGKPSKMGKFDRKVPWRDKKTHGKDVPTMAAEGGRIGFRKGGTDKKWMQKVSASIKKRGTKGKCTPITKPGCTGRAKALAKTFKKIAAKRKA